MALDVKTLLEKKGYLESRKKAQFDISVRDVGVFTFRLPELADIEDARHFEGGGRDDEYVIGVCCVAPSLKDQGVLDAYGATSAADVVRSIFMPGEMTRIAQILVDKAGYSEEAANLVDTLKKR